MSVREGGETQGEKNASRAQEATGCTAMHPFGKGQSVLNGREGTSLINLIMLNYVAYCSVIKSATTESK